MLRVLGPGFVGLLFMVLWLYCVIDIISTDEVLVRNLPKLAWLVLVIFVPFVGSLAWLAAGRPLYAGLRPGGTDSRPVRRRFVGPEDDPGFGPSTSRSTFDADRLQQWEDDLARRESELGKDKGTDEPT